MIFGAPEFLSGLFRTIAIMSIIGSIVILMLLLIKPIVKHRLPKSAQYYLWIVVLAVLLIPLSNAIALPADVAPGVNVIHNVVERNVISTDEARSRQLMGTADMGTTPNFNLPAADPMLPSGNIADVSPGLFTQVSTALMLLYPLVVLLILLFTVVGYIRFTAKVRRFNLEAEWVEKAILRDIAISNNIKHTPRLYRNTFVTTPMLIGLFKPVIILPDKEYTEKQLHSILLHEVIHFKRLDIIIKWVSLLACAVHWFNPIVWIARREISRACELSCDEAVIRNMDNHGKQNYGETLICVAGDAKTPLTVLSTTMCEEKRELKERLAAIMESKKYTKFAVLASAIVILIVTLVACTLGAGTATGGRNGAYIPAEFAGFDGNAGSAHKMYAAQYMRNWVETWGGDFFTVTDTYLVGFEKIMELDNLLENPIEIWRLDFHFKLEEGPEPIPGNDEGQSNLDRLQFIWADDGEWIVDATATDPHGGGRYLIFEQVGEDVNYLGVLYEHFRNDFSTREGADEALRHWLEWQGIAILPEGASEGIYILPGGEEASANGNALESLAGVWTGMGLFLELYADGTWIGNTGDTGWRGNIEITREEDGSYTVELIAIDITGPGGMFDNYGNMREEAPAIMEAIEAGEYDWWLPIIDGPFTLLIGTYSFKGDRFTSYDAAGNLQQMERWTE